MLVSLNLGRPRPPPEVVSACHKTGTRTQISAAHAHTLLFTIQKWRLLKPIRMQLFAKIEGNHGVDAANALIILWSEKSMQFSLESWKRFPKIKRWISWIYANVPFHSKMCFEGVFKKTSVEWKIQFGSKFGAERNNEKNLAGSLYHAWAWLHRYKYIQTEPQQICFNKSKLQKQICIKPTLTLQRSAQIHWITSLSSRSITQSATTG